MEARAVLPPGLDLPAVLVALRAAGARFAFLHGSRVLGTSVAPPREASDLDVAAWFGGGAAAPASWEVAGLPALVDLLVLDTAPLELAGRVAQHGLLVLDLDPPRRVAWQAQTRKVWLDERPRVEAARRLFARGRSAAAGGGARGG